MYKDICGYVEMFTRTCVQGYTRLYSNVQLVYEDKLRRGMDIQVYS